MVLSENIDKLHEALLAQWLERAAVNRKVTGSIPVGSVFFFWFACLMPARKN